MDPNNPKNEPLIKETLLRTEIVPGADNLGQIPIVENDSTTDVQNTVELPTEAELILGRREQPIQSPHNHVHAPAHPSSP